MIRYRFGGCETSQSRVVVDEENQNNSLKESDVSIETRNPEF